MKQERVIAILDFYRDIDKTVTMNERVIRNLEDQYGDKGYHVCRASNSRRCKIHRGSLQQRQRRFPDVGGRDAERRKRK